MAEETPVIATPQEKSIIDQAREAHALLKEQLDRKEALMQREEALAAKQLLGGRSDAGSFQPKPLTEDEKILEEAKAIMKGTGLNPFR